MEGQRIQKAAIAITHWVGSPSSIVAHTLFFIVSFALALFHVVEWNSMLLVVTTIVSLEAIYLAIFIQMTINLQSQSIQAVEKDIDEIQEDIDEMQEDVEEITEDIDEIQEDVDELQEDVEDIEEEGSADEKRKEEQRRLLETIQTDIQKLLSDLGKTKSAEMPVEMRPEVQPAVPQKKIAAKQVSAKKRAKKSKTK